MAGRLRTIDARTLADAVLEPPGYAVKDLLVQGLHILAGAPKTGKSWLALWLCQQVAGGEKVWGHPTQQGTVLYLCLEDGYHRLQDRLLDITEDPSENLYLATHAGTLADGLAGQIETFVREHGRVSLIVIDTLQKVRETCTDNTYARDYADLARLKELADRCRTTVLLVHHLRKQYDSDPLNRVSGTASMSGAADGTFILQREDRSSNYGTLFCTGRDIESKELKLQFDPMSHIWECREDEETARSADEEVIRIPGSENDVQQRPQYHCRSPESIAPYSDTSDAHVRLPLVYRTGTPPVPHLSLPKMCPSYTYRDTAPED